MSLHIELLYHQQLTLKTLRIGKVTSMCKFVFIYTQLVVTNLQNLNQGELFRDGWF